MKKVREFRDDKSIMVIEEVSGYYLVHIESGASLSLMREVHREYKDKHLFAAVPVGSRINRIASLFGEFTLCADGNNLYHIKGD